MSSGQNANPDGPVREGPGTRLQRPGHRTRPWGAPAGSRPGLRVSLRPGLQLAAPFAPSESACHAVEVASRGPLREGPDPMVSGSARRPRGDPRLARGQLGHSAEDPADSCCAREPDRRGAACQCPIPAPTAVACALHAATWKEGSFKLGKAGAGGASSGFPSVVGALSDSRQHRPVAGQVRFVTLPGRGPGK
jgi:hypothetical protein